MSIGVVDFSRVADLYDETRQLPSEVLHRLYDRLEAAGIVSPNHEVLDAGCGTGQLSLPLIERGVRITGVDVSEAMLENARSKIPAGLHASYVAADVRELFFDDRRFDAVLVSKLFEHVAEWRQAASELARVTRGGGHIVHVIDRGLFVNQVRARFSLECDRRGFCNGFAGLPRSRQAELRELLIECGAQQVPFDCANLTWEKPISFGTAFSQLQRRAFAEFWNVPESDHHEIQESVSAWIGAQPCKEATVEVMKPWLAIEIYRIP